MKHGKAYQAVAEKIDRTKLYPPVEALELARDNKVAKFDATITEINVNSQRLKALVEILGRETPVDLTFPQVQKV